MTLLVEKAYYMLKRCGKDEEIMSRKLVIDGNAVYEIDEDCMLRRRLDRCEKADGTGEQQVKDSCESRTDSRYCNREDADSHKRRR